MVLAKESCEPEQVGVIISRASAVLESFGTGSGFLEKPTGCVAHSLGILATYSLGLRYVSELILKRSADPSCASLATVWSVSPA